MLARCEQHERRVGGYRHQKEQVQTPTDAEISLIKESATIELEAALRPECQDITSSRTESPLTIRKEDRLRRFGLHFYALSILLPIVGVFAST